MPRRRLERRFVPRLLAILWLGVVGCASTVAEPPALRINVAPALSAELSSGKYARGAEAAPVTIVEFADYQCPHCSEQEPVVQRLLGDYDTRVRFVFHDYLGHQNSLDMAEIARCAGEQGGFWAMHDFLFKHFETVDTAHLGEYASALGLDGEGLAACVKSGRYGKSIEADAALAEKAGVPGTPTFFINGRRLAGIQTYAELAAAVDEALASLKVSTQDPD